MNLSKIFDRNSSRYDKYLCIGDFNSDTSETTLTNFCDLYKLKDLVREPTYLKNPDSPPYIDLLLRNCSRSFQDTQVIETGLSDFHKNESNSFENVFYEATTWDHFLQEL